MRRAQSLSDACAQERLLRSRISGARAQATNLSQKRRTVSEQVCQWQCFLLAGASFILFNAPVCPAETSVKANVVLNFAGGL